VYGVRARPARLFGAEFQCSAMPVLERYAGMVVVRCREFERPEPKHYDNLYDKRR